MTLGRRFYDRELSKIGRLRLLRLLQLTTATAIAARCRVTQQAVSSWAAGSTRPCARAAAVLEHVYAIPVSAWGEPVTRTSRPGGRRRR